MALFLFVRIVVLLAMIVEKNNNKNIKIKNLNQEGWSVVEV